MKLTIALILAVMPLLAAFPIIRTLNRIDIIRVANGVNGAAGAAANVNTGGQTVTQTGGTANAVIIGGFGGVSSAVAGGNIATILTGNAVAVGGAGSAGAPGL